MSKIFVSDAILHITRIMFLQFPSSDWFGLVYGVKHHKPNKTNQTREIYIITPHLLPFIEVNSGFGFSRWQTNTYKLWFLKTEVIMGVSHGSVNEAIGSNIAMQLRYSVE